MVGFLFFGVPAAQKAPMPEPTDPTPAPTTDPTPDPSPADDVAKWRAEAEKARKDAAAYREKLRAAEEAAAKAKLTDEERRTAELKAAQDGLNETQRQLQAARLETAVERTAQRLGIVDGDAAYRLLDSSAVEFDDSGKPTNVQALLEGLLESRPWLKGGAGQPTTTGGSASAPARSREGGLTVEAIRKMSRTEIMQRMDEVTAALSGKK